MSKRFKDRVAMYKDTDKEEVVKKLAECELVLEEVEKNFAGRLKSAVVNMLAFTDDPGEILKMVCDVLTDVGALQGYDEFKDGVQISVRKGVNENGEETKH